ncbi:MAG: class I SAM-dependent methyltransferase [Alphaproteobacteria bacterium]
MPLARWRRGLGNLARPGTLREAGRFLRAMAAGHMPVYLDYPVRPASRYGWGRPPHAGLQASMAAGRDGYARWIECFAVYAEGLAAIPEHAADPAGPCWDNPYVGGLTAAALYCFPALFRPRTYLEIGSGWSTRFARHAIRDHGLETRIVSVDPQPRAEIDGLCDEVIRQPLEDVDLTLFDRLGDGDILYVDNSHRCFQNADVTVLFLDVLPALRPGVLVYFDDIFLPLDYPPAWHGRFYSEQYLLAVLLLADRGRRYEIVLPGKFVQQDPDLNQALRAFWQRVGRQDEAANGLWLRVREP